MEQTLEFIAEAAAGETGVSGDGGAAAAERRPEFLGIVVAMRPSHAHSSSRSHDPEGRCPT